MITDLSSQLLNAFMQKIADKENYCGFTLPLIFENGSPAIVYASADTRERIILTDFGLNIQSFEESVSIYEFDGIKKLKEIVQGYDSMKVKNGCLIAEATVSDLDFTVIEYTEVISKLVNYQYRSYSHKALDQILASIREVLEKKFESILVNPPIKGRSGEKYYFNFAHKNTFIDFIQADKNKTNKLLRKMIDTQNLDDDLKFNIIIDDLENDKYKSEQMILSEYAVVKPLSKFLRAS